MDKQEFENIKRKFYKWVSVAVDEMPERNFKVFNDMDSDSVNKRKDVIRLYLGNSDEIWMYVKSKESKSPERTKRMMECSAEIRSRLNDQHFREKNQEADGLSIGIRREWTPNNPDEWPVAVKWIKDQLKRIKEIIADPK